MSRKLFKYADGLVYRLRLKTPSCVSFLLSLVAFSSLTFYCYFVTFKVQPSLYIDELFHVPQAKNYCALNFSHWDSKITTLPGLYVYSVLFLWPASYLLDRDLCILSMFRLVNSFSGIWTFCLLYCSFKRIYSNLHVTHDLILWSAFNLSFFPVLYFFNFLYYTDVASTMWVLAANYLHLKHRYTKAAVAGAFAVLMRQTNVVWVGFLFLDAINDFFDGLLRKTKLKALRISSCINIIRSKLYKRRYSFLKAIALLKSYITVCLLFIAFVYLNGGIVVGDRSNHEAVFHLPQLLYFSLFCTVFSLPFALRAIKPFLQFCLINWKLSSIVFVLFVVFVRYNMLVHNFLLADNRHYSFYLWKLLLRHSVTKYLMVPCYMFCVFNITFNLFHNKFLFVLIYWFCVTILVVPQKLLEFRYFILPYIFYRLNLKNVKRWELLFESILFFGINFFVMFVFVNKEFHWPDQPGVQRIGW